MLPLILLLLSAGLPFAEAAPELTAHPAEDHDRPAGNRADLEPTAEPSAGGNPESTGIRADLEAFFRFLDRIETFRANFKQRTYRDGILVEALRGSFELKRPDRFRWIYEEPYHQEIIADGREVWIYDPDLLQVTVKPQTEALNGSPALILGQGSRGLRRRFVVETEGRWLIFKPRRGEAADAFLKVEVLFWDGLREMRLFDRFGQTIEITFQKLQENVPLPDDHFRFSPPPGVDVIRG